MRGRAGLMVDSFSECPLDKWRNRMVFARQCKTWHRKTPPTRGFLFRDCLPDDLPCGGLST